MIPRQALFDAGRQDPAHLAASLVPEGAKVHVAASAPPGLDQLLVQGRGVVLSSRAAADVLVGCPDDIDRGRAAVITATHAGHGSLLDQPTPSGWELPAVMELARSIGDVHATVRYFEGFPATGAAADSGRDPEAWIRWFAVAAGPDEFAPPPLLPPDSPTDGIVLLAKEPWNHWTPTLRNAVLDLHARLREQGRGLVLSWEPQRLGGALANHLDLRRAGIVLHGGDGVFDPGVASGLPIAPGALALLAGHRPTMAIVLDKSRATQDLDDAAMVHPGTRILGLDAWRDVIEETIVVDELPEQADAHRLAGHVDASPSRIAGIEVRARRTGLTSVVIPVYGRWDLTSRCLDALLPQRERLEVIVVDNGSPDQTAAALAERDDVTTLTMSTNLGFAAGTNVGLRAARGEFVCLLNNDTEVIDGWLDEMTTTLRIPGTAAVGPRSNVISGLQIVPNAPRAVDARTILWGQQWAATHRGRSWLTNRLVGFCLLLRGSDLEGVGGLDEGVGVGNFEDDELCARLRAGGGHLRVADGAVVLHHGSATFATQGIDYLDALRAGRRHVGDHVLVGSDLVTAHIGVGEELEPLRAAVRSAWAIADEVVVLAPHERRLAVRLTLRDPAQQHATLADPGAPPPSSAPWTLRVPAGKLLQFGDWGGVRSAIEALPRRPHQVGGADGAVLYPSDQPLPTSPPVDLFG